ncbi:MAG: methyltransferase domain-containing protein [Verrucomicrobiae bacterium]|nr:methyltransferase domain-containing protein [Verrucomicrobiae bacterium]
MPKGPEIRPSPDKVKQAIFSSLGESVAGARVLDLYTGTGALGLEALSRGASEAVMVDNSRFSVEAALANAEKAGLADNAEVIRSDAIGYLERALPNDRKFDIILADPPYEKTPSRKGSVTRLLLNCPGLASILAVNGVLVMEHFMKDTLEPPLHWELRRQLRHGDTTISFLYPKS